MRRILFTVVLISTALSAWALYAAYNSPVVWVKTSQRRIIGSNGTRFITGHQFTITAYDKPWWVWLWPVPFGTLAVVCSVVLTRCRK